MYRILVVEDERPINDLIEMNLTEAGYSCVCAYDGLEAANLLEKESFDLVLLDIKQFNPERHRTLTGRSNEQTLRTAAWLEEHEHPFWLRYVLVPGYSDSEEDTRLLGESLGKYQQIQRVEILPYHRLGVHKYEAMGWDYKLKEVKENTPEQLERAEKLFKEYFTNVITN